MSGQSTGLHEEVTGYVRSAGKKLLNGDDRAILLRGVGFGSWLLPEGYMWRFPDQGDRPRRIERAIEAWIGPEKARRFWDAYYERYISEADIRRIAEEGFNSVRVPLLARMLLESDSPVRFNEARIRLIDRVIAWCRQHRLYVILDLHGAPGGQTGTNIDDSERDLPELFTDERHLRTTVELWRQLADRYKDEWIVAGYDLLNEPLPNWFSAHNDKVMPLYRDIIAAIREVDPRHMIILEGVHWATDWSIFGDKPDGNLLLQFHKYWNNPDTESIREFLDKREEWQVPIFMGEGGENNKEWYAGAFRLFEDHDISWNFWTWKKMDTDNSPCSIRKPEGWDALVAHLEGGSPPDRVNGALSDQAVGQDLDPELAERVLWTYLDHLPLERCDYHPQVVRALFRRTPVTLPAIFYGYRGEGVSFGFAQRTDAEAETDMTGRCIGFREADGTDIRFVHPGDRQTATFEHGRGEAWRDDERLSVRLSPGDWLAYDLTASRDADYVIRLHLRAVGGTGRLEISANGREPVFAEAAEEGWSTARAIQTIRLEEGEHRIVVKAVRNAVQLEWLEVTASDDDGGME